MFLNKRTFKKPNDRSNSSNMLETNSYEHVISQL